MLPVAKSLSLQETTTTTISKLATCTPGTVSPGHLVGNHIIVKLAVVTVSFVGV